MRRSAKTAASPRCGKLWAKRDKIVFSPAIAPGFFQIKQKIIPWAFSATNNLPLPAPAGYQLAFCRGNSRRAHTLWLPHFPHRSRFTKVAIGASGRMPRRTKSDPVRRPV
jgi:hypothetical protein